MTSYTKKLYERDPALAHTLRKNELEAYRYGRHVTLACFTPAAHDTDPVFGKRTTTPPLPAYECWAPELGKPKAIVRAADSFAARKEYAAYHQIAVVEVAARKR